MNYKSVDLCIKNNKMSHRGYSMLASIANELGRNNFHVHHMDYYYDLSYIGRIYYTDTPTSPTICSEYNKAPWSISKLETMAFLAAEHTETITGVDENLEFVYGTDEDKEW